jgi:glycerophosphoryl diester phosphodiesterase
VEFDVQLTRDGQLAVIHDETVDRTSDGTGRVVDFTLSQLREFNASARFEGGFERTDIPTLDEVLDLLAPSPMSVNIELKNSVIAYPGLEERVIEKISEFSLGGRVVLSSFSQESVQRLKSLQDSAGNAGLFELAALFEVPLWRPFDKAIEPDPLAAAKSAQPGAFSELGDLFSVLSWRPVPRTVELGAQAVHPPAPTVWNSRYVRKAHEAGLKIRPWVADLNRTLAKLISWGCDAVFTNVPDVALRLRDDIARR